jgi:hypothetical protein
MRTPIFLATLITLAAASATSSLAAGNGTDILHFMVRNPVSTVSTEPALAGFLSLSQNRQGKADNQRFDLTVQGLTPAANYLLWASYLGDAELVYVTQFTAAADGSGALNYMKVGSSQGKGKGKGTKSLPAPLDPLARLRLLVVTDASTQAVAQVALDYPAATTYLVSRKLNRTGLDADAAGSLRLKANSQSGDLRVQGSGLQPGATSLLWLNGEYALTRTNDSRGSVQFTAGPLTISDTLSLRTLAVSDAATNLVLTTTLP